MPRYWQKPSNALTMYTAAFASKWDLFDRDRLVQAMVGNQGKLKILEYSISLDVVIVICKKTYLEPMCHPSLIHPVDPSYFTCVE